MGGGSLGQFADFELELYRDRPETADHDRPLIATLRKNRSGPSGASFQIFPRYPSLCFENRAEAVELARKRRSLFRPVGVL